MDIGFGAFFQSVPLSTLSLGLIFKTLFEEPLPHPNRMASLAMANSIRLSGLLGWDSDSKSYVAQNIDSHGCFCTFLDGG